MRVHCETLLVIIMYTGDDRPILRNLYDHVVPSVAHKWRDLGVKLLHPTLIEQRVLEVIAADHPHRVEDCCKSMFEKWLNTQEDASWQQLLEALQTMQLNYLADQIENKLMTGKSSLLGIQFQVQVIFTVITIGIIVIKRKQGWLPTPADILVPNSSSHD